MAKMTWLERRYRRSRLDYVRHITIDPRGPGVVRIHMIPPRTEDPADPFLLLLNGAQLVPLNLSWAILLANFMDQLEPWSGREIGEQDWQSMLSAAETAHGLGMELDFTSPGWLPEEALRDMGLHLIPSCGACLSNMALAPDGTVLPCQSWLEGPGLGNLLTDDWSGIWDGEPCRRIRAESAKMEHICQLQQEGGC